MLITAAVVSSFLKKMVKKSHAFPSPSILFMWIKTDNNKFSLVCPNFWLLAPTVNVCFKVHFYRFNSFWYFMQIKWVYKATFLRFCLCLRSKVKFLSVCTGLHVRSDTVALCQRASDLFAGGKTFSAGVSSVWLCVCTHCICRSPAAASQSSAVSGHHRCAAGQQIDSCW